MEIQVKVNHIYRIVFIDSSPEPDLPAPPSDGYYRVLQQLSFDEMLRAGQDSFPKNSYGDSEFLKIRNMETDELVYVPESYVAEIPHVDVKQYPKMVLTLNLGLVSNPHVLSGLQDQIAGQLNALDSAVFRIPWLFVDHPADYTVDGDHVNTSTLTLNDTSGIEVGQRLDDTVTGIQTGTTVSDVDSSTQISLNQSTATDVTVSDGTTITIGPQYTVDGEHTSGTSTLTLTDTTGISAGDAVDDSIDGMPLGITVDSVDSSTQITLSRDITGTIADGTKLIIEAPDNSQPEFTADNCYIMTYDQVWRTDDEVRGYAKHIVPNTPDPYQRIRQLEEANSKLRAHNAALEELVVSSPVG